MAGYLAAGALGAAAGLGFAWLWRKSEPRSALPSYRRNHLSLRTSCEPHGYPLQITLRNQR